MDGCEIFEWKVVPIAPERVIISCLMHDTRLGQIYIKMINNWQGTEKN